MQRRTLTNTLTGILLALAGLFPVYALGENVRITNGEWPLVRGHILTPTDLIVRQHILNIMCRMHTDWRAEQMQLPELPLIIERLKSMQEDGLLEIHDDGLTVLEVGRPFIRNIAMAFDLRLWEKQPETRLFSMTI